MSEQEQKLREAEYFYEEMIDRHRSELFDQFNFNLSAFLTAARSILQYTYETAEKTGRQNDYNSLVSNSPILQYFKKKRDFNIHVNAVKAIRQINMDMQFTLVVRDSVKITKKDSVGNILEERNSESADLSPPSRPQESIKRTVQYKFSDWPEEDVIELSRIYLFELRKFISNAKIENLI